MLEAQYVPEIDVLIAVAKWLHSNDWTIESLSIPSGQGIGSASSSSKLRAELAAVGIEDKNIRFVSKGEDIRARQGSNLWKIECKGLSSGTSQTDRNNLDRAIASAVSYYTQRERLRLGLALPEWYKNFFPDRLPQALREAIELWVFLYCGKDEVYEFAPDEKIPV